MKKLAFALLASVLIAPLFAQDLSKHLDITVGLWDALPPQKDDVQNYLEKKFNITLKSQAFTWDDYPEKVRLWAAGGDLPDVFADDIETSTELKNYISQKVVRALPANLSAYPNVKAVMDSEDVLPLKQDDGKFYVLPRQTYSANSYWANDRGMVIRKDWLAKVGITKLPETYDEYKAMFKAFVEKDPDGNGKKDTVGLTIQNLKKLPSFLLGSAPNAANQSWIKEDGKWIPGFASKNVAVGLKQIDTLYKEDLLDKDFYMLKNADGIEKFAQGKAGAILMPLTPNGLKGLAARWANYNKTPMNDSLLLTQFWKAPDGNRYYFNQTTWWSSSYFSTKVDDEKMARILALYDFLLSPEGKRLVTLGIPGKDYQVSGTTVTLLRKPNAAGVYDAVQTIYPSTTALQYMAAWSQDLNYNLDDANISNWGKANILQSQAALALFQKTMKPIPTNWAVTFLSTPNKDKFAGEFYVNDLIKAIVSNQDPVTEWNKTLDGYRARGLDKAIEEVNQKVN